MTYPGKGAFADIIKLAADYEQTFGHAPLGGMYSNQTIEVPVRERIEQWNRRADDNVDQRAARPPPQQNQRENNRDNRNWQCQRDFPERHNQQPAAPPRQIAPINPPREAPAPTTINDIDTLTREMERLRFQIAELQRPQPTANFVKFVEHDQAPQQPTPEHATIMYDGFTDPFPVYPIYATKRPAESPPEADPLLLRRRPNNLENTTVDPRNIPKPAAPRPVPAQRQPVEPTTPAAPPPAPAREAAARPHVDLGGLPPLPNAARPAAYRRPEEFNMSIKELEESREEFLRNRQRDPPPARATNAEVIYVSGGTTSTSETDNEESPSTRVPQSNLQRNPVNTTVATVPIIINDLVFEDGIIDTVATNTMISQSAARQLNLIDQIEPSRLRYSCVDGKMSIPWGNIRKLPVGVEGLVIPIDVFVSGATSYDVLLGTGWLTQAHAEISFAKQGMSFRIQPQIMGRVPITVMPAGKSSNRYCVARVPGIDFDGPAGHPADPGVPGVPGLPNEIINIENDLSEESQEQLDLYSGSEEEIPSTEPSDEEEAYSEEHEASSSESEIEIYNATVSNEGRELELAAHPYMTEDWMLETNIFREIETHWGPFDLDACCDLQGHNSQLPLFWSAEDDCLQQSWTDLSIPTFFDN
eukprot:jgi/Botrbrau1/16366/Bobra.0290s0001.1